MAIKDKHIEIGRLIAAFEAEAGKFHDIQFHTFHVNQEGGPILDHKFAQPNHCVMLWQYYGMIDNVEKFVANVEGSDLKYGLRGAALTLMGVIEGGTTELFCRMAARAGSLFDNEEANDIKLRVVQEIIEHEKGKSPSSKPVGVVNSNPLSVWLNYLLYYLSQANPGRDKAHRIDPDPFSLSLLALERLSVDKVFGKSDRSNRSLSDLQFKVALSFPGEKRRYVSRVADALRSSLGDNSVFYDHDYQAQLARPNLDTLLQRIYRKQSGLVVIFICEEYSKKQWCGLEWRAIREIIKTRDDDRVMMVRFDDAEVEGVFSIDGFIDARILSESQVAAMIARRVADLDRSA